MHAHRRRITAVVFSALAVVGSLIGFTAPASAAGAGIDWTTHTSAVDNDWNSVAYGNGLFVAVAWSGAGDRVMTSPDGITWTTRTTNDNEWNSVTYGNGLFVAVAGTGTGDRIMTSPDGITWTTRTSARDNLWYSVTYGNGLFVAVSLTGTGDRVMTSPDGITWTTRVSASDNEWASVTYGNGLFVAVAATGTGDRVMTSPDGITWTTRTSARDNLWNSVTYGNGLFVAVSWSGTGDRVMTSPDGITWTSRVTNDNEWNSVTYASGLFVAVGSSGTGDRVMTSPDGITWTTRTTNDNNWYSVAYGNGLYVAVASSGTGDRVMTSGVLGVAPTIGSVTITGTKDVGQTLRANTAGITGTPAPSVTYQWQSSADGATWANISRATSAAFVIPASLNDQRVRVVVTATNATLPLATKTSSVAKISKTPEPTPTREATSSIKGKNITLAWTPGNTPVLSYEVRCAKGESVVRVTKGPDARKATLTVTEIGLWTCRVGAVNALGKAPTTPIKVVVH